MNRYDLILKLKSIFCGNTKSYESEFLYSDQIMDLISNLDEEQSKYANSLKQLIVIVEHRIKDDQLSLEPSNYCKFPAVEANHVEGLLVVVDEIDSYWLTARVYDYIWSTLKIKNDGYIKKSIQAYMSFPLETVMEYRTYWVRCLTLSIKANLVNEKNEIIELLLEAARSYGHTLTVTRILFNANQIAPFSLELSGLLEQKIPSLILEEKYIVVEAYWNLIYEMTRKRVNTGKTVDECNYERSKLLRSQAGKDLESNNFYAAASRHRESITLLKKLSKVFKEQKNIGSEIDLSERVLVELRKNITDLHARTAETQTIDLSEYIEETKSIVKGDSLEDFLRLQDIDYHDLLKISKRVEKENSIASLFFGSTIYLDDDGRVLGTYKSDAKEVKQIRCFKMFITHAEMAAVGCILPALKIIKENLLLDEVYFQKLVASSAIVPEEQTKLMSKALWYGYNEDFLSAIMIICPLVESMLRATLKATDIPTVTIDEASESEKSLSLLLGLAKSKKIINGDVAFKIEVLFSNKHGFNFRNKVAHGLINDYSANSPGAIYVWWLCLKWIIIYSPPNITNENQ